ncbi:MAG: zinc ribbon domain-containing protein [Candidatus Heimdallarchaeota archaeon]
MVDSNRPHPFLHRSTKILSYQQFLLIGLAVLSIGLAIDTARNGDYVPVLLAAFLLIISIDIIGFSFLGLGFYSYGKIKQSNRLEITFLVMMIFSWIIFTMINRSLLIFHLLTADEWLVERDISDLQGAFILDFPLFFYTWIIALFFLTSIFLLIALLLRKIMAEPVNILYYVIFAVINCLSLLYIGVSMNEFWFFAPIHFAYTFGPGVHILLIKLIILPILAIMMFKNLENTMMPRGPLLAPAPVAPVPAAPPPAAQKFCPNCGKTISVDSKFCAHCGSDQIRTKV